MKGTRKVFNRKTGALEDGKAAPWLPPAQLRGLPSSWVTRDTSDPDRVHELDAPHVVESLVYEQQQKEQAVDKPKEESIFAGLNLWDGPFDQTHIDFIRFKAIRNLIRTAMVHAERGSVFPLRRLRHLWFPKAKLDNRELRDGRPPLPRDRPRHLKDKDLIVDVYNWPPRIVDELKRRGIEVPDVGLLEAQMHASRVMVMQ